MNLYARIKEFLERVFAVHAPNTHILMPVKHNRLGTHHAIATTMPTRRDQ